MRARQLTESARVEDLFRLLARFLAPHLQEQLRPTSETEPAYYDQENSPLGRRQHLELVRRRILVGHKSGRKVLVRCDDVHAFIESRESAAARANPDLDAVLGDWGLERRSRR